MVVADSDDSFHLLLLPSFNLDIKSDPFVLNEARKPFKTGNIVNTIILLVPTNHRTEARISQLLSIDTISSVPCHLALNLSPLIHVFGGFAVANSRVWSGVVLGSHWSHVGPGVGGVGGVAIVLGVVWISTNSIDWIHGNRVVASNASFLQNL